MALIDKASLLMVPSTYEAGKLYNVLPSGNRAPDSTDQNSGYDQTRADFDFDRGSNTAATRIGSDGLLKKYRENLLVQSNQFDTTWTKTNTTLTSGQIGYDGGSNAWKVEATNGVHRVEQNVNFSGVNTISVYAKKGNATLLRMQTQTGGTDVFFDLNDGTIDFQEAAAVDAQIEAVGTAGWYRCSMTINETGTNLRFLVQSSRYSVSDGDYLFIQSAQLESGLVSTDYLESTSVTGKAGVLVDLPRINFDANGENGSLLLEPSRLQMLKYSEYANEWDVDSNVTTTINAATSPEGVLNAVKLEGLTTSANNQIFRFIGSNTGVSVVGKTFSCSLYIKPVNPNDVGKNIELSIQRTAGDYEGLNQTFEIDSADWKRYDLSYTFTGAGSGNQTGVTFKVLRNSTTIDDIYCFGAQCEEASYPSSYIPNNGESGGITRAADFMSSTNNLLAGADDMAWFVDYTLEKESTSSFRNQFGYRDNADANFYMVQFPNSNTHEFRYRGVGGVNVDMTPSIDESTYGLHRKIVYLKRGTTLKVFCNGSQISTTTNAGATTFSTTNENFEVGSNYPPEMNIKEFVVFNGTISDAEAITLTTL